MIELKDLQNLEICMKCKCVYLPEFEEGCDYARTLLPVNIELCARCEEKEELRRKAYEIKSNN